MVRNILLSGDKILRTKSKEVKKLDRKIISLIQDLKDTLKAQKDPEGVGLAAPQIGKNFRVFAVWPSPDSQVQIVINPKIVSISKNIIDSKKKSKSSKKIMEGCLSLPNYYTPLERKFSIKIQYRNEKWEEIETFYEGVDAQIIQHEIDHLDGILFIDRMLEQGHTLYEYKKGEWEEVEL